MGTLLDLVLSAHGDLERWHSATQIKAHLSVDGAMWGLKGHAGQLVDEQVVLCTREQRISFTPFTAPDRRSIFEPGRVAIETSDGSVIAERTDPRTAFASHTYRTLWDDLHLAYFTGYATWNYLTTPFLFTLPGVEAEETEPWIENGETWRRLRVRFPSGLATHSPEQTFYYGDDGLLRRLDYSAEVVGGVEQAPAAQYVTDHKNFSGFIFPTKRRIYRRNPDNSAQPKPVVISIDILDLEVS
ncbi:hypothetical protein [Streptomyces sp. NPDC051677]|uniref:hypothetical protein n=1 Tax=Streptomyces sp. NPDC051677 TaxID=3365669 RepID=UPI0037CE5F6B